MGSVLEMREPALSLPYLMTDFVHFIESVFEVKDAALVCPLYVETSDWTRVTIMITVFIIVIICIWGESLQSTSINH